MSGWYVSIQSGTEEPILLLVCDESCHAGQCSVDGIISFFAC